MSAAAVGDEPKALSALDRIYLRATRLMTGSAGWPNNLFLTPELKPFFAGSYWPRNDDDAGGNQGAIYIAQLNDGTVPAAARIAARCRPCETANESPM